MTAQLAIASLGALAFAFSACRPATVTTPTAPPTEAVLVDTLTMANWAAAVCGANQTFWDTLERFDAENDLSPASSDERKAAALQLNDVTIAATTAYLDQVGTLAPPADVADYHEVLVGGMQRIRELAREAEVGINGATTWSEVEDVFLPLLDRIDAEAAAVDAAAETLPPLAVSAIDSVRDCGREEPVLPDR